MAARGCVQCAVTGFSIRDYYVYVPMDCVAAHDEIDTLMSFSLYGSFGYRYNVTMTRSDLITLKPAVGRDAGSMPDSQGARAAGVHAETRK